MGIGNSLSFSSSVSSFAERSFNAKTDNSSQSTMSSSNSFSTSEASTDSTTWSTTTEPDLKLENISKACEQPIYRLPCAKLLSRTFGAHVLVQAVEVGLTPNTDWLQFMGSSGLALAKLLVNQGVTRGVNLLHSSEITHNKIQPFNYSIFPNLNIRDRSILGQMTQHAAVHIGSILLTNALVGGVPVGLVAYGVGGALSAGITTSLNWQAGLVNDDLLAYDVPNRNAVLARTISVNTVSQVLSNMAAGGFQGLLLAGTAGVIPGAMSHIVKILLEQGIEVPRSLISHYLEYQRGQEEIKKCELNTLYYIPCELNIEGDVDLELEEAALIAQSLSQGIKPWLSLA